MYRKYGCYGNGGIRSGSCGKQCPPDGLKGSRKAVHKDLLLLFLPLYIFLVPVTDFFGGRAGTHVKVRDNF